MEMHWSPDDTGLVSFCLQPSLLNELLLSLRPVAAANFYQRALLANALTSALRLHQRLPHFQLSRAFLSQALQEDSCHYLLYSLILVNSYPITSILLDDILLIFRMCTHHVSDFMGHEWSKVPVLWNVSLESVTFWSLTAVFSEHFPRVPLLTSSCYHIH